MTFDKVTAHFDELFTEQRALRVLLVPAHRQLQHQAQQPQRRPREADSGRSPAGSRTSSSPTGSSRWPIWSAAATTIPTIAKISSRALSARTYTDIPYKVFTSPRRVRFVEMEYAVPREALVETLRELKTMVDRSSLRVSFPVEVRTAPADYIALSTASGRESAYIAVHMFRVRPIRRTSPRPSGSSRRTRAAPTGQGAHPRRGVLRRCIRASASSRRCGTALTRIAALGTTTCAWCWARRRTVRGRRSRPAPAKRHWNSASA